MTARNESTIKAESGETRTAGITPRAEEPWVELDDAVVLATWGPTDEVAYNQQNRQVEKYRFFVRIFDFLNENQIVGDYHEYGCHRGRTFRMALTEARRHNLEEMRFYAFDSFGGLPAARSKPDHALWRQPGALATSEEEFSALMQEHGLYPDRIETVKGFYDQSLTPALQHQLLEAKRQVALACVDCDLYESAVAVLRFLDPLLGEGSVIYLDDLFAGYAGSPARGVARAFLEHQAVSCWRFIRHLDVGWWGRSYIAVSQDADIPDGVL